MTSAGGLSNLGKEPKLSIHNDPLRKRAMRFWALLFYYGIARYLPQYLPNGHECRKPRANVCKYLFRRCGFNVNIKRRAFFGSGRNIEIGDNSDIGYNAYIAGIDAGGEVVIGNNVIMAPDVVILTLKHEYGDISVPISAQKGTPTRVTIEDDAWLGLRVIILPGIKIGKGAIVGAGAVVTKDVPEYTVVGGVPARVIRRRAR